MFFKLFSNMCLEFFNVSGKIILFENYFQTFPHLVDN